MVDKKRLHTAFNILAGTANVKLGIRHFVFFSHFLHCVYRSPKVGTHWSEQVGYCKCSEENKILTLQIELK